jgi:hypothetical protein
MAAAGSSTSRFGVLTRRALTASTVTLAAQRTMPVRTLCTTRTARAFYYNKKDFEASTTEEFVNDWKYSYGGKNHPLWWKLWVGGAVTLFVYEHIYEYTRPVQIMFPAGYGQSGGAEAAEEEEGEGDAADDEGGDEAQDAFAAADEAPEDEAPAADAPSDDAPADDAFPGDAPSGDAPSGDAPDGDAPADEDP